MNYPGQGLSGRYVIVQMDNGNLPLNLRKVTAYGIVGAWNVCEMQETGTGKKMAFNWLEHEYVNVTRENYPSTSYIRNGQTSRLNNYDDEDKVTDVSAVKLADFCPVK